MPLTERETILARQRDRAETECFQLEAKIDELKELLEERQWTYDKLGDYYYCQTCGGKSLKHEPECRVKLLLSEVER